MRRLLGRGGHGLRALTPRALLGLLYAGASAPLLVAASISDPTAIAGLAVVGAVGAGPLGEVIKNGLERLARDSGETGDAEERTAAVLAAEVEQALARDDEGAARLRGEIAAILKQVGAASVALEEVRDPESGTDVNRSLEVAQALAALAQDFGEFSFLLADVRATVTDIRQVLDRVVPAAAGRDEIILYLRTLFDWLNTDPWPQASEVAGPALTPAAIERKLRIAGDAPFRQRHSRLGPESSTQGGWVYYGSWSEKDEDLDADELGKQCSRLVVLGGPGSGKTWLAKRTARLCAGVALEALKAGRMLEEVELPLYTTCARLAEARPGEGTRRAAVASALGHLPDLGGSRVLDMLQMLFEDRDAPTLLVADSLDEARGVDDRIRTLPQAWRLMLTTRPAAWKRQLAIKEDDPSQRVGVLQPLRYPDDVEAFIAAWFGEQRYWAAHLRVQLHDRPNLQQAATVPLILAFYCIIGGGQTLPSRRTDLYEAVIDQMLIGPWRGSAHQDPDRDREPDLDACVETLRAWAWSAAASNPISGVGTWADEFPTRRVGLSEVDSDALDHVAVPLPRGPADVRARTTRRRFVHRSLREHLVAKHVAYVMSAEEAAGELLKHLWFDPDWEYAAPAALAMHPQRNEVLKELICRVTGGDQLRADIAAFDGGWEFRQFLARVAQESGEADWSADAAEIIGRARSDLAGSRGADLRQVVATDWPASNGLIIETLLGSLANERDPRRAGEQADTLVRLAVTAADRAKASEALLTLITTDIADPYRTIRLPYAVARLAVTAEDRARAREALLGLLAATAEDRAQAREENALLGQFARDTKHRMALILASVVTWLDPATGDLARVKEALLLLLDNSTGPEMAPELAERVAALNPAAGDLARAREALLGLLATQTRPDQAAKLADAVVRLGPTAADLARAREALLGLFTNSPYRFAGWRSELAELVDAIARLDPAAEDLAKAMEALLKLLADPTGRRREPSSAWITQGLADEVVRLAITAKDRARAREALLGFLGDESDPQVARELADTVARLDPTAEDLAKARDVLLRMLADPTHRGKTLGTYGLPPAVARLAVTTEDRARAREALLGLLADAADLGRLRELAETIAELNPTAADLARAREVLLGLLADPTNRGWAGTLADAIVRLDPAAEDLTKAMEALLGILADATFYGRRYGVALGVPGLAVTVQDRARAREALLGLLDEADQDMARQLAQAVARLDPAAADLARATEALLRLLGDQTWPDKATELANTIAQLNPAAADLARARQVLFGLLASETRYELAAGLMRRAARPDPAAQDVARAREALLGLLADETDPETAQVLADVIVGLDPAAKDLARVREALLGLLDDETDPRTAQDLADVIARLDPATEDLAKAKEALLLLADQTDPETARKLADSAAKLDPQPKDLAKAKEMLLSAATDPRTARELADTIAKLSPSAEDLARAREALLGLLPNETDAKMARDLTDTIAQLNPAPGDLTKAKEALLGLLAHETDHEMAQKLAETTAALHPTIADLGDLDTWPVQPSPLLLAAARRNSELPAWLAALQLFSNFSGIAAEFKGTT